MGTSRKFHTKTRNGCTNCKKRRVKCNLQAPQCHHCKRRGEECSFQFRDNKELTEPSLPLDDKGDEEKHDDGKQEDDVDKDEKRGSMSPVSCRQPRVQKFPRLSSLSPSQWPELGMDKAQLRLHYTKSAADSLALLQEDPRRVQLIWKGEVILKSSHDAWLDGACMAIAALHICHLKPPNPEEYYIAAFKNYHRAVVAFPKAVKVMNPENSVAILSFSLLLLMFQLGVSCVPGARPLSHALPLIDAYNAVSAMRGTWSLIDQLNPHLTKSHLSSLFIHRKHLRFEALDENHEKMLESLQDLNANIEYRLCSDEKRQVCNQAITVLRFWFSIMAAKLPTTWLLLLWWPAGVSPEFIQLLKERDPMALIIFCHWCAEIHHLPAKWYLDGWAENMLTSMLQLLRPKWSFAVKWPINEVFHSKNSGDE